MLIILNATQWREYFSGINTIFVHRELVVREAVEWSPLSPNLIPLTSSRASSKHKWRYIKKKNSSIDFLAVYYIFLALY